MVASIGEMLVSILVQFEIGEFDYTEGKPPNHEPLNLFALPLIEKATEWGISVKKDYSGMCKCHGHYNRNRKEIQLASTDVKTFLHGLTHAAIERLSDTITHTKPQQQEIMAELAACTLFQILMNRADEKLSNSYSFILFNAVALNMTPLDACLEVFSDAVEIIEHILGYSLDCLTTRGFTIWYLVVYFPYGRANPEREKVVHPV